MFELPVTLISRFVIAGLLSLPGADTDPAVTQIADAQRDAAPPAAAVAVPDLTGSWCGQWISRTSGHQGPLKARFCRVDASHYDVHFRGRFCKLIPFCYRVTLCVTSCDNGCVTLTGSRHLPIFGTFTITARANGCQFSSNYCSEKDNGQFRMSRVQ